MERIFIGWLAVALLMAGLWRWQRRTKNAGIVDVGWAASLGLLAIWYAATTAGPLGQRLFVAVLVSIWSFRLSSYLYFDRVRNKPEDGRYAELRESWAHGFETKLFLFFQFQALASVLLSLAFIPPMMNPSEAWAVAGFAIWLLSVVGESIADRQLARFRADPANRGKSCAVGLWRYSRHPNYFFEWLHWWTYPILSVGAPFGLWTVLAPLAMLFVILKVTGIPPTEARSIKSRGEEYRAYQRRTSAFFPWPPKEIP